MVRALCMVGLHEHASVFHCCYIERDASISQD